MSIVDIIDSSAGSADSTGEWSYAQAFCRNQGLIAPAEQARLRDCRVAIPGMGGVGGVHLTTLARMGIGKFTIADPDVFEPANFNRQAGATIPNLGRHKTRVMAEQARAINPELDLRVFPEELDRHNVESFLEGADVLVDGIDFFAVAARRLVFQEARRRGIWAVTAGPIGFSTAWLAFDPRGMSFDEYFDLHDDQDYLEQLIAFAVGLTPRATQRGYFRVSGVRVEQRTGPSLGLACQLASGVAAAEVAKILLQRGIVRPAPWFAQFDAYRGQFRHGRLRGGNRHPWQRLKRWVLARQYRKRAKAA